MAPSLVSDAYALHHSFDFPIWESPGATCFGSGRESAVPEPAAFLLSEVDCLGFLGSGKC